MYRSSRVSTGIRVRILSLAILAAFCAVGASAQLEVGDNVKMNLTGDLGFGYSGAFGNTEIGSSHSQGLSGSANLTGYYFHPNFINFEFRPYYERQQSNSDSQTLTSSNG